MILAAPPFGRSRPIARRSWPRDGAALAGSRRLRRARKRAQEAWFTPIAVDHAVDRQCGTAKAADVWFSSTEGVAVTPDEQWQLTRKSRAVREFQRPV